MARQIKTVLRRCVADTSTELRTRYRPWYHTIESANGLAVTVDGRSMVMMSSNEYLGLSWHPRVIEAATAALREWGASSCGSRLANGSRAYHIELEQDLAAFLGKESCHVFSAGYLACAASLRTIAQRGDALLVDPSVHASLWDGAMLSRATIIRFDHQDPASLEQRLQELDPAQPKVIAVDGVYSITGEIAPLPEIADLADRFDAALVVDDAHGLGVLGRDGRGVLDHFAVTDRVDLVSGSFSKSLASTGGFVAGQRDLIEYLRTYSREMIFSAALSPAAAAATRAALAVMQEEPQRRERCLANAQYLRRILDELGLDYGASATPSVPIILGDREKAYRVWKMLWDEGFFTVMALPPGVPPGQDLLRIAATAAHTTEQLDRFGEALGKAVKRVGLTTK